MLLLLCLLLLLDGFLLLLESIGDEVEKEFLLWAVFFSPPFSHLSLGLRLVLRSSGGGGQGGEGGGGRELRSDGGHGYSGL